MTNSYSSISSSSVNACASFTPPTNSPFPGSRLSCRTASPRSPRTSSAFQSTLSSVLGPTYFLAASIDPAQRPRPNVLLGRVDRPGERLRPSRHPCRSRRLPPGGLHHLVRHAAEEQSVRLAELLGRLLMQFFVRDDRPVVAAPIQCDVDGKA